MSDFKPIETIYKGYRFRSRLEARWAVFFDTLGIEYEYEPEGFQLSNGELYLPDFYIMDLKCYFEVKRKSVKGTNEGNEAIKKISYGKNTDSWAGLICFGDPADDDLTIFCQEVDDGGGGSYESEVTIGLFPDTKKPYLFSYNDNRPRDFMTCFCGDDHFLPMVTKEYGTYGYNSFVNELVILARMKARQARFEHGETPA